MPEKQTVKQLEVEHWKGHVHKAEEILGYGNKTMSLRQKRRVGMFVEAASIKEGKRILEIGCGTGNYTRELSKTMADITAVDLSQELLDLAKRNSFANVEYRLADIENLPFRDGTFDAVVGNSVLHHCNIYPALCEIRRVLKDGGRVAFSEPNMLNPHVFLQKKVKFLKRLAGDSPGETAFFKWRLKGNLIRAGFSDIVVQPFDFLYPFTPSGIIKIVNKLGMVLENIPVIKEIAGSLVIYAGVDKRTKNA